MAVIEICIKTKTKVISLNQETKGKTMSDINLHIIMGRLGSDPEVKNLESGTKFAKFSVATGRSYTKNGEKVKITDWHTVYAYNKLAEVCENYLAKGCRVYIQGWHQTKKVEGTTYTNIQADKIDIIDFKDDLKKSSQFDQDTPF
jgi:single-strand DNA-binding protein